MWDVNVLFSVLLQLLLCLEVTSDDEVLVNTKYGTVQGRRLHGNYSIKEAVTNYVDEFLGIPYAAPPIGELRWQPPQDVSPWKGVRNATQYGWVCPQPNKQIRLCDSKDEHEDCLYLNIYSPYEKDQPDKLYPVMYYVHGGSYVRGTGNRYNGTILAQHGVVVVTINYRLFALGFLTTGGADLEGNYGLLDQIKGLEWVKENIEYFRGNSSSVTIFGNSAGGASVSLLYMSPLTTGLLHKVIIQSGTPNGYWSTSRESKQGLVEEVSNLADQLGCPGLNVTEQIACMRQLHWTKLDWEIICKKRVCSMIDPDFNPVRGNKVVPESIDFKNIPVKKLPVMIGLVSEEFDDFGKSKYAMDFISFLLWKIYKDADKVNLIQYAYTNWTSIFEGSYSTKSTRVYNAGEVFSDVVFTSPTLDFVHMLTSVNPDVRFYMFDNGTCYHSVELNYIFGVPYLQKDLDERGFCEYGCYASPQMKERSQLMMKIWSDFAKSGNPELVSFSGEDTRWHRPAPEGLDYLYLSQDKVEMRHRYKAAKSALWNIVIPNFNTPTVINNCKTNLSTHDANSSHNINSRHIFIYMFLMLIMLVL